MNEPMKGSEKVWVSKKKYKKLEKRIADLEGQVQSQQEVINLHFGGQMHSTQSLREAFLEAFQSLQE